mmetsp:Transcript_30087/g.73224  ORF Transcript_30087/g.73224 Transcript_30087/m.73224 type:complete len:225 (+) Transcript_30087:621-1295(+)
MRQRKWSSTNSKYSCSGSGSLNSTRNGGSAASCALSARGAPLCSAVSRRTNSFDSSQRPSNELDCTRSLPAFFERRIVASRPHRYWMETELTAACVAASASCGAVAKTSSKSERSEGGGRLASSVMRYFGFLTGATTVHTRPNGRTNSQREQRGSPETALYVATTATPRSTGSWSTRQRKVSGTMVGVRLPDARDGSNTVSVARKMGAVHEARSVTFSRVLGPT